MEMIRRARMERKSKFNEDDVDDIASMYDMEFKWKDNDAWYTVKVELSSDDDTLTVKFLEFEDYWNKKYTADDFHSEVQMDEFADLFRPLSKQVQDNECSDMYPGMKVCAVHSPAADDLRYYDAVIEAVHHESHLVKNGEEECSCTFVLCWIHGPKKGNLTPASIANICTLVSTSQNDPRIALFTKRAKEKLKNNSKESSLLPEFFASAFSSSLCSIENEELCSDKDMGGDDLIRYDGPCYFLIDNLECDLSPSSINHFIKEHTSVSPEAYVFPRLSSVPYSSAAIAVDSRVELEKVYKFLANPKHLIVSSRGRPWVIIEQEFRHGTFRSTHGGLAVEYQDEILKNNKLKMIQSGTEEYKKATEIKSLFMEFVMHEQKLYQRLALKESTIFES